jgi:aldose sugar dehydrogenase
MALLYNRVLVVSYGVLFLLILPLLNVPMALGQSISDSGLRLETVANGLNRPTAMAFLGPDDMLVIEKDDGTVQRIIDGEVQEEPVLDVAVANDNGTNERGLLGLAVDKYNETTTYVFLYYTESGGGEDGDDSDDVVPAGNRLYRYELVETRDENNDSVAKLINPKLLLDLTARPGPRYNGGPLLVTHEESNVNNTVGSTGGTPTPATTIYLMIGDLDHHETKAQNFESGPPPDGTGGILKVDIEGKPLPNHPLVESDEDEEEDDDNENNEEVNMLDYYFAYGIRNSFGMDVDPVTGFLWDTENGPNYGDEINLVQPGFNSGWMDVQGMASSDVDDDLEDFDGSGEYSDPEFVWDTTVGVTAIKFFNSTQLGEEYEDDLFVGDINDGRLYHFDLDGDRRGLMLDGPLSDDVADNEGQLSDVIFGTGFTGITDLEVGPDGYLYILMYTTGQIMRIVPG